MSRILLCTAYYTLKLRGITLVLSRVVSMLQGMRFRSRNIDLEEREHSGRPAVIADAQIETLIKINPGHTTLDIADMLQVSNMML